MLRGGGQGGQVLARVAAVKAGIEAPAPEPALVIAAEGVKGVAVAARPAGFAGADTVYLTIDFRTYIPDRKRGRGGVVDVPR